MRNKEKTIKINGISKTLKILFAMALLFTMTFASRKVVKADIASGINGTCSWLIDDDGTLTIRPTNGVDGTLESYTSGNGPFYEYRTNIKKVVVENGVKTGTGCRRLFAYLSQCNEIDLSGLDTSNATSMNSMFFNANILISINLGDNFDTSNVTDMNSIFSACWKLSSLDLGDKFNTFNVTNMKNMFGGCSTLTSLNLGDKFDTSDVTDMSGMFNECQSLTSLDLGDKFNTSNVTDMSRMFYGCKALASLNLGDKFDTSNVTNMKEMFRNCEKVNPLNLRDKFDTSNVTNMRNMFNNCEALTSLNLGDKFDTSNVTNMGFMFQNCAALTSLNLGDKFDTSNVTDMLNMFVDCKKLASLDLGNKFDTSNVTDMSFMFTNCKKLTSLDIGDKFDTSNVTDMNHMFANCISITSLNLGDKFDTSNVSNMSDMFSEDDKLSSVNLNPEFSFTGNGSATCTLPTPPSPQTTGKWIRADGTSGAYEPADLRDNFDSLPAGAKAGEWVWEVKSEYAIFDFNSNGGVTTATRVMLDNNSNTLVIPDSTSTQYHNRDLLSWNTKKDGSGISFAPGSSINIDLATYGGKITTLFAQWSEEHIRYRYTVKHYQQKADLSGYDLTETEKFEADKGTTVTPAVKSYPNFTSPTPISGIVKDDDSLIISYKYDRPSYTVVFNGNGATSGIMASQQMPIGIAKKLNASLYENTNSIFTGWNTASDGSGTGYTDTQSVNNLATANNEITLYAQWMSSENQTLTPQSGQVTVKGKSGETIVIPNIPDGTNYSVTETNLPDGWTQTGIVNGDGTIVANESSEVTVTNRYAATGKARIVAHKRLQGGDLTAGAFEFELYKGSATGTPIDRKGNDAVDPVEELSDDTDGTVYANPWYGTAPVYFDELNFTQADIGQTYTYYIKETNGGDSHISYDSHTETVTITISDAGHGMLNCNVSYDADGALFTNNQIVKTNELSITKTVDNRTDDTDEFKFTVSLKDLTDSDLADAYEYDVIKNSNKVRSDIVRSGGVITLKNGEKAVIKSLPENTKYEVAEQDTAGYTLVNATGNVGTITDSAASEATFTNHYRAEGTAELTATKTLANANISDYAFSFDLLDENLTTIQTKSNDGQGNVAFDPLTFTEGDIGNTYTYYIKERVGEDKNIVYDKHTEEVTITVENGTNGALNVTTTYDNDGANFRNEYHYKADGYAVIEATKTLEGGDLADYTFDFELLNSNRQVIETKSCDANGKITFSAISYTEEDINKTYTYYIREKTNTGDDIEYDDHVETVTVRITDNGDSTLNVVKNYDADGAKFENRVVTSYSIQVNKIVENHNPAFGDMTFTFVLEGTTKRGERVRFEKMVTVPSSKQASFVWENIPAGNYTIKELSVSRYQVKSITGSSNVTPHETTADIALEGDGTQVTFTNRYDQHNKLSHNNNAVNHID